MLVLQREPGDEITIGDGITLTVLEVRGDRVKLGVVAPEGMRIVRQEQKEGGDHADLT